MDDLEPETSRFNVNRFRSHDIAGLRRKGGANIANDSEFGKWETYTKGIGSKLLMKMGYKPGEGLGKHGQGITAPIEAKKRPERATLGSLGRERDYDEEEDEELSIKNRKKKDKNSSKHGIKFTKGTTNEPKDKVKFVVKSLDDILAEADSYTTEDSSISKVKVIDMRGPEVRLFEGYQEMTKIEKSPSRADLGKQDIENKLIITEKEVSHHHRLIKIERDRLKYLDTEECRIKERVQRDKECLQSLQNILFKVRDMNYAYDNVNVRAYELVQFCRDLCSACHKFKHHIDFKDIIVSFCFPIIEQYLQSWKPLVNPDIPVELFREYRAALTAIDEKLYDILMWDIWLPVVRRAIISWPSIRQCDEIINLLETWQPFLQEWLLDEILSSIILPRLKQAVEAWEPLSDTVPVHSWIHPWLPLMADHSLEPVYEPLRHKLSNALVKWHPSDRSAKMILQPWKHVFEDNIWSAFLARNILPKLELILESFVINPHQQILDMWNWFIDWEDMMPIEHTVSLLSKIFFPKWLHVLYSWLIYSPNYDEVSRWYEGWKTMFSQQLLSRKPVQDAFAQALEIMNHALTSPNGIMSYNFNASYQQNQEDIRSSSTSKTRTLYDFQLNMNFEEFVERKANELALAFMPVPNRYYENFQVHKFGKLSIYMDNNVLYFKNNDSWDPISITDACNKICLS